MKLFRKVLILGHRYLGIAGGLLVMMWFLTGFVMMYAGGMPRLTPQLRLERQAALDFSRVRLTRPDAASRAGLKRAPGRTTLLAVMERPAYRFAGGSPVTVFADTGDPLDEVSQADAQAIAGRFMRAPVDRIHFAGTIDKVDQWTLGQGRQLPLFKFQVDDDQATELYVSPQTGDVSMLTTRRSRALAWAGTIPHWLYFTALRASQPVWYQVVVWTSVLACVIAILGLFLAVTQLRRSTPFQLATAIPYAGWMRWHYLTGAVFGVFTLTWAFSGLLSMEPFAWTNAEGLEVRRDVFTGGPVDLKDFQALDAPTWQQLADGRAVKEVDFVRIQDEPYYVVRRAPESELEARKRERLHQPYGVTGQTDPDRLLVSARTLEVRREPFSIDSLVNRLKAALPDVPVRDATILTEYDWYYYSRGRQAALPVLRVRFDNPMRTWFYIDPEMSQIVAQVHRLNRVERWLYNGLHSLDFSFWYNTRPLWDIGMIVLLGGCLASSTIGFCLGIKRLRRGVSTATAASRAPAVSPVETLR